MQYGRVDTAPFQDGVDIDPVLLGEVLMESGQTFQCVPQDAPAALNSRQRIQDGKFVVDNWHSQLLPHAGGAHLVEHRIARRQLAKASYAAIAFIGGLFDLGIGPHQPPQKFHGVGRKLPAVLPDVFRVRCHRDSSAFLDLMMIWGGREQWQRNFQNMHSDMLHFS